MATSATIYDYEYGRKQVKLYEFEGHDVFSKVGIKSPSFVVCKNVKQIKEARKDLKFPIVAKVQIQKETK